MPMFTKEPGRYIVRFIFATAAIMAAVEAGFLLTPAGSSVTLIWPPSALGLAILFLFGYDLWPAITIGIIGAFITQGVNLPLDIGISIADTLEALAGAYFLRRYVELDPMIARLRDSMGLLVSCIAPTFLAAMVIAFTSYVLGRVSLAELEPRFVALWIGHAVSMLSFTPFLIRWLYRPLFSKNKEEVIEGVIIFGGITVTSYFTFWTTYNMVGPISLVYILLILLIWAAMRTGPRGTTLALALMSGLATSGILYGHGLLSGSHGTQIALGVQVLLGALDILFLLFTSIVEERKEAVISLTDNVRQLEVAIEKIRSEDQAKTNFLAILAHELRNPLAPIITSIELIKMDEKTATDPALVQTIETHARTITLLLDDLLDVSRITQNKFELRRERLPLSVAVQRSLESVKPFIELRRHTLTVSVPKDELYLDADPVRFEQILVNLLNNAAKYTDAGGHISLSCTHEGRQILIRISDNGIGIASDKLPGVFEPFGQRGAVMRTPGGLGIGLSLTKQLAELHGGTIEAYSKGLDQGSTFTVRLPLSMGEAAPSTIGFVNRLRNLSAVTPKKILVVDDNEPAANGIHELLKRRGHEVECAFTGTAALTKVAQMQPDVVLLDIGLPDMTGYEVAQQMRSMPNGPRKLIALTGYGQDADKTKSIEAGFDAHLVKPVSLADVEAVL